MAPLIFASPKSLSSEYPLPVSTPQPKAVLFVDDEKSYVELMTELLAENLGCSILSYMEPQEALADLPKLDVGIIITDYSMPSMNGVEFLKQAYLIRPRTPSVMITGHQIELAGRDLSDVPGLQEILYKPVNWRTLAERIIKHWPDGNPPKLKTDAPG